jgi:plasmid stabilization system protein ParE
MPVHLRPSAEADLIERTRYYRREAGDAVAERFGVPGLRVWRINGFPCGWYYFVVNDAADVVRLLADMQDLASLLGTGDDVDP